MRTNTFTRRHSQGYAATQALSNNEIMLLAPSVFAEEKHCSRSDRYEYIPTSEILVALRNEGFEPYYAQQSKSRIEGKSDFTKHMLRFRHMSQLGQKAVVGQEVNEVIFVGSHDGTSKTNLYGGVYRFVCCNGLMVGDSIQEVSMSHRGYSLDDVIEGAYTVLSEFDDLERSKQAMKDTRLTLLEQRALGLQGLSLKFDMNDFRPSAVDIIMPRREEDRASDLWTTFNVIQENLIQGGIPKTVNPPENGRRGTTRQTINIPDSVRLNRSMWDIATAMRMSKEGLI